MFYVTEANDKAAPAPANPTTQVRVAKSFTTLKDGYAIHSFLRLERLHGDLCQAQPRHEDTSLRGLDYARPLIYAGHPGSEAHPT